MNDPVIEFLKRTPPFQDLPDAELEELAQLCFRREFPADQLLYQQDVSVCQELSLIYAGSVEKYFQRGEKKIYPEVFVAGETFGAISMLLNNNRVVRSVRTLEPTVLLQLPDSYFRELCRQYEEFSEFFTHEFGRRMLNSGYAALLSRKPESHLGFQSADLAFSQRLEDLAIPHTLTCDASMPLREAARLMSLHQRDHLLVLDRQGRPAGILTDAMLRSRVLAAGLSSELPVSTVMEGPVPEVAAESFSYEAILAMIRLKTQHIGIRIGGAPLQLVSLEHLLHAQGKSPFIFLHGITQESDAHALQLRWAEAPEIVETLIQRGTRPEIVNPIVSAIADAVVQNVVQRAVKLLGPAPARFAFLALGSEGRKEQTLCTDQDNAIVFEDVDPSRLEGVQEYFLKLGEQVCAELDYIGFAYCEGGLMAKNPEWNLPLSSWKKRYRKWLQEPAAEHAILGCAFFDSRTVYGDPELLEQMRESAFEVLGEGQSYFLNQLARISLTNKPPLTLFGGFQLVEQDNKRKGLNLKRAMGAISDFARVHALQHRLPAINTEERLSQLQEAGVITAQEFHELHQSFFFMMRLRLQHQSRQIREGEPPDNLLTLDELSKIERVTLKEIFRVIEQYQKRLSVVFAGVISA